MTNRKHTAHLPAVVCKGRQTDLALNPGCANLGSHLSLSTLGFFTCKRDPHLVTVGIGGCLSDGSYDASGQQQQMPGAVICVLAEGVGL